MCHRGLSAHCRSRRDGRRWGLVLSKRDAESTQLRLIKFVDILSPCCRSIRTALGGGDQKVQTYRSDLGEELSSSLAFSL